MHLYDTRRRQTAKLDIPHDRPITVYVCGVTPYDTTHIGHAHTFLIFDVLVRYLRFQGAQVHYCQNVTDVDDPLFERAARDGVDWQVIAQRETQRFLDDNVALNMLPPTFFPKASEEIAGMLVFIEQLIARDHAYVRNGNVYYRVKSDPTYGELAHMDYAEMLATANERGNDPSDPNKIDPLDFVLWRVSKPGEASWPSPWSAGRPGWHIECSTMAMRYLGPQIDIHGGGRDLIFPHHPSEVAQSEPVTGVRPFVRFWVHGGLVALDGEKMSKSLGNMVFVHDALKQHSADALRWYLLSFPYREDFSYERAGVAALEATIERLRAAIRATSARAAAGAAGESAIDRRTAQARAAFLAALDDDLQMALALTLLNDLAYDVLEAAANGHAVQAAQATLRELAGIMGFWAAQA